MQIVNVPTNIVLNSIYNLGVTGCVFRWAETLRLCMTGKFNVDR